MASTDCNVDKDGFNYTLQDYDEYLIVEEAPSEVRCISREELKHGENLEDASSVREKGGNLDRSTDSDYISGTYSPDTCSPQDVLAEMVKCL